MNTPNNLQLTQSVAEVKKAVALYATTLIAALTMALPNNAEGANLENRTIEDITTEIADDLAYELIDEEDNTGGDKEGGEKNENTSISSREKREDARAQRWQAGATKYDFKQRHKKKNYKHHDKKGAHKKLMTHKID